MNILNEIIQDVLGDIIAFTMTFPLTRLTEAWLKKN